MCLYCSGHKMSGALMLRSVKVQPLILREIMITRSSSDCARECQWTLNNYKRKMGVCWAKWFDIIFYNYYTVLKSSLISTIQPKGLFYSSITIMGIAENWLSFVNMTRAKADSHGKVAQSWDRIHNILSLTLIVLSALTTISTLLPITIMVNSGVIVKLVSSFTLYLEGRKGSPSNSLL